MARRTKKLKEIKGKIKTMDRILFFLFTLMIIFIITMVIVFIKEGSVPDTLIISVFGYIGLESGCMASIQNQKRELESKAEQEEQGQKARLQNELGDGDDSSADMQFTDHTGSGGIEENS